MWEADRQRRASRGGALVRGVAVVSLLVAACVSRPTNELAPGYGGDDAQRLLVLPLNLFLSAPSGADTGLPHVDRELEQYLRDHGKQVERLDVRTARGAWARAIGEAARALSAAPGPAPRDETDDGSEDRKFEAALHALAPRLAEQHAFDALLIPAVVPRTAVLSGLLVRWDGVSRRMRLRAPTTRDSISWSEPEFTRQELIQPSLWSVIVLPDGTRIFEGFGGLDLLTHYDWENPRVARVSQLRVVLKPVDPPFADPDALREGIARALAPYLAYRPTRPEARR